MLAGLITSLLPFWHTHTLITLALRECNWFAYPLAAPAHLIDPRDLLLMISSRMQVPM